MQLTMTGEYAIRMMVHLSKLPAGDIAQIGEISKKWEIPETFLRKIGAQLSRAGLVKSHRGIGGGVSLGRPAEKITLLEVIEEMEGPMSLNRCVIEPESCTRSSTCEVHGVWCQAQDILRKFFADHTFADMAH